MLLLKRLLAIVHQRFMTNHIGNDEQKLFLGFILNLQKHLEVVRTVLQKTKVEIPGDATGGALELHVYLFQSLHPAPFLLGKKSKKKKRFLPRRTSLLGLKKTRGGLKKSLSSSLWTTFLFRQRLLVRRSKLEGVKKTFVLCSQQMSRRRGGCESDAHPLLSPPLHIRRQFTF